MYNEPLTAQEQENYELVSADVQEKNTAREATSEKKNDVKSFEQEYHLLSRLQSDCDYFLSNGAGHEKHLWAGNVEEQIAKMHEL